MRYASNSADCQSDGACGENPGACWRPTRTAKLCDLSWSDFRGCWYCLVSNIAFNSSQLCPKSRRRIVTYKATDRYECAHTLPLPWAITMHAFDHGCPCYPDQGLHFGLFQGLHCTISGPDWLCFHLIGVALGSYWKRMSNPTLVAPGMIDLC